MDPIEEASVLCDSDMSLVAEAAIADQLRRLESEVRDCDKDAGNRRDACLTRHACQEECQRRQTCERASANHDAALKPQEQQLPAMPCLPFESVFHPHSLEAETTRCSRFAYAG